MTTVVDASALVDMALASPRGLRVTRSLVDQNLFAPELIDVEVASALARLERSGDIGPDLAEAAHQRAVTFPAERIPHRLLNDRAWGWRHAIRVADAYYVACASVTQAALLTTDARLARASLPEVTLALVR